MLNQIFFKKYSSLVFLLCLLSLPFCQNLSLEAGENILKRESKESPKSTSKHKKKRKKKSESPPKNTDLSKPIFLELDSPKHNFHGMFSVVNMVAGALQVYESGTYAGLKVDFEDEGLYYDPDYGLNWWEYYFQPINLGSQQASDVRKLWSPPEKDALAFLTESTPRETVHSIIEKYIHLKPHMQNMVDTFIKHHFLNKCMIGVHYRGTDKSTEAPRVPYEDVAAELVKVIGSYPQGSTIHIFVATDEQAFLNFMLDSFPQKICYLDNAIRSSNGVPVHYHGQNYKKGEEAVLDCILLSRCQILVRTSSNLSLFSTFFNPTIPVINLNRRY